MIYRVVLMQTEEGVAVFCPMLPGCYGQGEKEADALDDFREAAALWLDSGGTPAADGGRAGEAELLRDALEEGLIATVHEVGLNVAA